MRKYSLIFLAALLCLCGCSAQAENVEKTVAETSGTTISEQAQQVEQDAFFSDKLNEQEKEEYELIKEKVPGLISEDGTGDKNLEKYTISSPLYCYDGISHTMGDTPIFYLLNDGRVTGRFAITEEPDGTKDVVLITGSSFSAQNELIGTDTELVLINGTTGKEYTGPTFYGYYADGEYHIDGLAKDEFDSSKVDTKDFKMKKLYDMGEKITEEV